MIVSVDMMPIYFMFGRPVDIVNAPLEYITVPIQDEV